MATPTTLPAAFTAGQVLTAAQMNDLRGAFRVLQVVGGTRVTQTTSSTNVFVDTGLTVTITPQSATSKILVLVNQADCYKETNNTYQELRLMRDATALNSFGAFGGYTNSNVSIGFGTVSTAHLDSPATTSATTYKTQLRSVNNNAIVGCQGANSTSTITAIEISA